MVQLKPKEGQFACRPVLIPCSANDDQPASSRSRVIIQPGSKDGCLRLMTLDHDMLEVRDFATGMRAFRRVFGSAHLTGVTGYRLQ